MMSARWSLALAAQAMLASSCGGECERTETALVADTFPERMFHAVPSPDGSEVAASIRGVAAQTTRIAITDSDGEVTTVAEDVPRLEHLRWTADGTGLVVRFVDSDAIERLSLDGTRSPWITTPETWGDFDVAASTVVSGGGNLRVFDASGANAGEFSRDLEASGPVLSPSGTHVADVAEHLRVIELATGNESDLGAVDVDAAARSVEWLDDSTLAVATREGIESRSLAGESVSLVTASGVANLRTADASETLVYSAGGQVTKLRCY